MSDSASADLAKLHVLIENLPTLCNSLPASVPEATNIDLIHHVTTTVTGENPWHTFNRRFDILFSEDCRDDQGRLHHLKQVEEVIYLLSPQGFTTTAHVPKAAAPTTGPEMIALPAAEGKKKQIQKPGKESVNDDADKDYVPWKPRDVSESPICPYIIDEDGHKILDESDNALPGHTKKQAHDWKLTMTDSDSDASDALVTTAVTSKKVSKSRAKGGPKKKRSKKTRTALTKHSKMTASAEMINDIDVSSEDESDGQGALRAVEEAEEELRGGGPGLFHGLMGALILTMRDHSHILEICQHIVDKPMLTSGKHPLLTLISTMAPLLQIPGKDQLLEPGQCFQHERAFCGTLLPGSLKTTFLGQLVKLQVRWELPSDTAVWKMVGKIFIELRHNLVKELTALKSKISYSTDNWTMKQMVFTFAGTTASFINDEWELSTGKFLQERYDIQFHKGNAQIRCMAHVVNLVVQAMLASLDEARDPEEEDYFVPNKHLPFHYDLNNDTDLQELEQEQDSDNIENNDLELDKEAEKLLNEFHRLSPVKKLHETEENSFISSATEAVPYDFQAGLRKLLCTLMVIHNVATRWNYTHAMIQRALMLHEAIEKWVFKRKELHDELYLSSQECTFLKQLADILEVFTKVTFYMSCLNTPTLPWAIPMYHHMETALQSATSDDNVSRKLQQACAVGLWKLHHYFNMARHNHFNTLATICHPVLRLEWFRNLDDNGYTQAKIIFEHFIAHYELATPGVVPTASHMPPPSASPDEDSFLSSLINLCPDGKSHPMSTVPIQSEFKRYAILAQGAKNPNALSMPLIWWKWSSLAAATMTQSMCAKLWIQQGLFDFNK
ncbi:ribonuclease H-like domain-containing protein [Suillus bovinus]|uniref:ribonuclease H-like domain-containing protein n=1 Tax=Suillus bovinus TaxID=48563 RepID=UPI001B87B2C5|nr:ribonuclease H-like domain-containing protein [Suillus bovinus]KAG2138040.1 ribonuclease H-like domain-containing protein [Suillus bovinus]